MSFPDVPNGPHPPFNPPGKPSARSWRRSTPTSCHSSSRSPRDSWELKKPEELATAQADGKSTDLANGLAKALEKSTRPDAAVVLISDGIDNTSPNVLDAVRGSNRTVHSIWVGSEQAESATMANIAVDNIDTSDDFVVGHDTKVKAIIKSSALANRVVDVKLSRLDADGKPKGATVSEKLVLQPLAEGQTVELPYKPDGIGVHRLAVWVDPIPGERSTVDNRQEFQGLALDPRIKVLYIEGRARPEYRDLNRALARDANIEVSSLLRIQADRFAASGSVDGEPFKQMPTAAEQWRKFDVIILGDLDISFLGKPQQAAIEQRISDGGGPADDRRPEQLRPRRLQGFRHRKSPPRFHRRPHCRAGEERVRPPSHRRGRHPSGHGGFA